MKNQKREKSNLRPKKKSPEESIRESLLSIVGTSKRIFKKIDKVKKRLDRLESCST
jgi:hypothetical protein